MNQSHKLPALEGLRGIAALIVVIWHLHLAFFANSFEGIRLHLADMPHIPALVIQAVIEGLQNGSFAVWLFWTMSGFVLSLQFFLRAHQIPLAAAHDYLEEAFLRRYPRLLVPVFASVCFAYLLLRCNLMRNLSLAEVLGNPETTSWLKAWYTFPPSVLGAIKSAFGVFFVCEQSHTYNNVLWTMMPEFYGSLFIFSFLGLLGHRSSRFLAYLIVAFVSHKLSIEWLAAFVAGIFLCDLFANRSKLALYKHSYYWADFRRAFNNPWLAILLWILIITAAGLKNVHSTHYILLAMGAILVTLISRPTQQVLVSSIPMFLGRISFGLYLIHIPIICSFSCAAYLALYVPLGHTASALLVSAATVVLSIILGYLFYLYVDLPSVRWSRTFALLVMHAPKNRVWRTVFGPR